MLSSDGLHKRSDEIQLQTTVQVDKRKKTIIFI